MRASSLDPSPAKPSSGISRRAFLRRIALAGGAAAVILAGYSGLIETNEIDVRRLDLHLPRLSPAFDGFKIALLSDFHFGPYTGAHEIGHAVRKSNELAPDLVALLGDFVSTPLVGEKKSAAKKAEPCAQVLGGLRSRFGTLAVLGNHDCATDPGFVVESLQSHGISVLRNGARVLELPGGRISLLGLDDVIGASPNLEQCLAAVPAQDPKILLVHEPDYADRASRFGIDAQFSGHSHGGQVRIPGVRPLWLPPLGRKYYLGYYRVGAMQLYTNEGIGTIGLPFRFCSPPELTLVTLRAA